jgi:hypothetical protein
VFIGTMARRVRRSRAEKPRILFLIDRMKRAPGLMPFLYYSSNPFSS